MVRHMKTSGPQKSKSPSQLIDARIKELGGSFAPLQLQS
jgi:hypothetical protein